MNRSSVLSKALLAIMTLLGWFALIAQFYLIIINRTASLTETIVRYFSFFTILTNILVATCCAALLSNPGSTIYRFFSRQKTVAAITVYIFIVGLIYNVILRFIWNPQGLQKMVDELLHSVIPVAFLVFWLLFAEKNELKWKSVFPWLIYPFVYAICILLRGTAASFYPYPFVNVELLGWSKALLNVVGLTMIFLCFSLLLVAISKFMSRKNVT